MEQQKPIRNNTPLNLEEKKFIEIHCMEPDWTDERIAKQLGRSTEVVRKYRKQMGVVKDGTGSVVIGKSKLTSTNINKANITDEEKIVAWKSLFRKSARYERLQNQLLPHDLGVFEDVWAKYCLQFNDLKPSEEEQLEMLVSYKLRIDDNRRDYRDIQQQEIDLRASMLKHGVGGEKELNLEDEDHRFMWEMLSSNKRLKQEVNKQLNELNSKYEALFRSLNATREQREQFENIGGDTFFSLVRTMNENDKRREIGKYNELMKLATIKQMNEFKKPHKFINNDIDPIIMDGADYIKEKKKENKDE